MARGSDPIFSFEYWLVNHKSTLRTWWAVSLLSIILFGTVWIVGFMGYFVSQEHQVNLRLQQALTRLSGWSPSALGIPETLSVGDALAVAGENGRYDIVAMLKNPNTGWGATDVLVTCQVGSTAVTMPTSFVNPNETRPIIFSGQTASGPTECTIDNQVWHRVAAAHIEAASFSVIKKDVVTSSAVINGVSVPVVRVDATVRNDSGNNFQTVTVALIVRSGETIVAVDSLPLTKWATRTTKTINNTWTLNNISATSVDIVPMVSRFDPDSTY